MFSPAPMLRVSALVLDRDARRVLCELGRLGAMHLTRTPAGPESAPLSARDRSGEFARCDRLLARVQELRGSLEITAGEPEPAELTLEQAEEQLCALETQAGDLLKSRQQLLQRQGELTAVCDQMASYRGLAIPLEQLGRFSFLHFVTGTLPVENFAALQRNVSGNVVLLPLPRRPARQPVIVLTSRAGRSAVDRILQQAGFQSEALPVLAGATVAMVAETSRQEAEQVAAELDRTTEQLRTLGRTAGRPLAEIEGAVNRERCLWEAEQNFPRTEAAVLVRGWVPAAAATVLARQVRETTCGRCVIETLAPPAGATEEVPVLLRHHRLLLPFARLFAGYGLPRYRELSPTFFVAVSYLLMFGMMFGDVGHGLVLGIGGLLALRAGRPAGVRDVGLVVLCAGMVSAAFGWVYGSCFGMEWFKRFALWRDPLAGSPLELLRLALGVGVGMISLGVVLNIINQFRQRNPLGAVLDKFGVAGLVFYWGVLLWVTGQVRGSVWLALPVVAWMLKEPVARIVRRHVGAGGWLTTWVEGAVEAFEGLLVYLANTISFVRLAAYAMSHAALLLAAVLMAAEVQRMTPAGGWLGGLVIIGGNVVAIVLEGVIAAVQALRLEYYEFFSKFFSGNGRPFQPFCLATGRSCASS